MALGDAGLSAGLALNDIVVGATSGRVFIVGTGGALTDSAGITYNAGTSALTLIGPLTAALITGTGFKVGAATGVDASIVIPAVATITVTKGIITAVV